MEASSIPPAYQVIISIITPIGIFIMGGIITVGIFFIKDLKKSIGVTVNELKINFEKAIEGLKTAFSEKDKEHDKAIEGLRQDFNRFQIKMPETYVLREDYIRNSVSFDNKLDLLGTQLSSVDRKLSQLIGEKEGKSVSTQ